jgi:hypothetical protein
VTVDKKEATHAKMMQEERQQIQETVRQTASKIRNDAPFRVKFILAMCFVIIFLIFVMFEFIRTAVIYSYEQIIRKITHS